MIPTIEQFVSNTINQYVVRPTGSPNMIGAGGFLFDILDQEEVSMDAEITDHYVENNYAVQDHIALRPVVFTLRGYVAELRDLRSQSLIPGLQAIQSLAGIGAPFNQFAAQATQAYAKITDVTAKVNNIINQANNVFDIFSSKSTTANNQQNAFKFFKDLYESRQLCSVETPYQIFTDMAIMSIRAIQKGDTRIISDFSVTFKQIRKVSTQLLVNGLLAPAPLLSGRAAYAGTDPVKLGQLNPADMSVTAVLTTYYPGNN